MQPSIKLLHHTQGRSRFYAPRDLLPRLRQVISADADTEKKIIRDYKINPIPQSLTIYHQTNLQELMEYFLSNGIEVTKEEHLKMDVDLKENPTWEENLKEKFLGWDKEFKILTNNEISLKGLGIATVMGLGFYQIFWKKKVLPAGLNLILFASNMIINSKK